MKARRKVAGKDWEFDGSTITVSLPMTFARRGGRKVIIAPDAGDAWAPAKPRPHDTLIRALARAHRWHKLLEDGSFRSGGEIAEAEHVTCSFVNRLLRLTLLAPDIVEAVLDGRQPKGMQLEELTRTMPSNVASNRRAVAAELDVTVPDRITAVIGMAERGSAALMSSSIIPAIATSRRSKKAKRMRFARCSRPTCSVSST